MTNPDYDGQSPFTFQEYSEKAWSTAVFPDKENNLNYVLLGLFGECGEFAEKLKKAFRGDRGHPYTLDDIRNDPELMALLKKELGDVQWYLNGICKILGTSLTEVAELNIEKLFGRRDAGTLKGSGDNR